MPENTPTTPAPEPEEVHQPPPKPRIPCGGCGGQMVWISTRFGAEKYRCPECGAEEIR